MLPSWCPRHNRRVLRHLGAPGRARARVVLLALAATLPRNGAAERPRLNLSACRSRALETAPELKAATTELEASRLGVDIANAGFLPALRADGSYLRSSTGRRGVTDFAANNGENEYVARAVATEPLYTGGALGAARSKARADEAAAGHALAATHASVLLAADQAYFGVLRAAEGRAITEAAQAVASELLRAAQVRFRNGEVSAFDVDRFELEVAQATTAASAGDTELAIARSELGTLIGLDADSFEVEPLSQEETRPPIGTLDDLVTGSVAARPEVKRLEADLQSLESSVGLARAARLPQVRAEAAGGYDSLTLPDRHNAGWEAGVTLSMPLWDWSILARRERIARLDVDRARQRLAAARRAVTVEVTRRYLEADLARRRVTTAIEAEKLAERNAERARKGYGLGLLSSLDLVTAQHQRTAAASERAAAEFDQQLTRSRLDFATGRLE